QIVLQLKRSSGSHSAPRSIPYDNPLNTTEEDAPRHGHTIIPVERGRPLLRVCGERRHRPRPPSEGLYFSRQFTRPLWQKLGRGLGSAHLPLQLLRIGKRHGPRPRDAPFFQPKVWPDRPNPLPYGGNLVCLVRTRKGKGHGKESGKKRTDAEIASLVHPI
ncbi:hypothetical protein CSHISOI_01911, partial [Colletotrichum shisoi]